MDDAIASVEASGREVPITSPSPVFFPERAFLPLALAVGVSGNLASRLVSHAGVRPGSCWVC